MSPVIAPEQNCPNGTDTNSAGTNTGLDTLPMLMVGICGYLSRPDGPSAAAYAWPAFRSRAIRAK